MTKLVEFIFDVGSPTAYLAWTQLPGLIQRTGADVKYTPVLLGGLFKASGNASPVESPAKAAYIAKDCERYAKKLGTLFKLNPHFPVNTMMVMRAVVGAQRSGDISPVLGAAFRAMWVGEKKLDDPNALEALADAAGVSVAQLARWISDDSVKGELRANTDQAAQRGAFGAPTFFIGDEMFFGQDRMDWVEEALRD
ncbi:MAG: DsbA family protein [Alphaproteobacteria bacterium]